MAKQTPGYWHLDFDPDPTLTGKLSLDLTLSSEDDRMLLPLDLPRYRSLGRRVRRSPPAMWHLYVFPRKGPCVVLPFADGTRIQVPITFHWYVTLAWWLNRKLAVGEAPVTGRVGADLCLRPYCCEKEGCKRW